MKVVVLCPYPENCAPSQRLKYEQYFPSWRRAGYEVVVRPFWDDRAYGRLYEQGRYLSKALGFGRGILRRVRDFRLALAAEIAYVHLEVIPLGPPVLERALAKRTSIVFDLDDLVFLPHSSNSNRFMRFMRSAEKTPELIRLATEVIVCTERLVEFATQYSGAVTNISSTIDTTVYRPKSPSRDAAPVTLGWSGSHSTSPYLHLLDSVIRDLTVERDIRLRVIGDPEFAIDGVSVHATRWRLESEVADLAVFDIGLYPLPDEEWVLGKSGLKALQYMALGIPTVAQRTSVNETIIEHGVDGLLASTEHEWIECILALIDDPELRARLGSAGRRTVEERYSVAVTEPTYLSVLERASSHR